MTDHGDASGHTPGDRNVRHLFARLRSCWHGRRRRNRLSAEMGEKMRFHVEMEAARLAWVGGLSLDLKLAWRMLMKSPGLTVVGVLGIAFGVAVGTGFFIFLFGFFYPTLPLEEGDRIVAIANWDVEASERRPSSLAEFVTWREEMRSVEQIAAASMGLQNLVTGDAVPLPVQSAEMTAAAFDLARVPPLLGRFLVAEDEGAGAPRVAVLGYDLWQTRFGGDPGVLGRLILVGDVSHEVVGVMPPGFALPMNQELWTALTVGTLPQARGEGPALFVFGRLAPGVTQGRAQAEISVLGRQVAADVPDTHARLRPQVIPYTYPLNNVQDRTLWNAARIQFMVTLLLLAIAVNIAVLVYARTAMRKGEFAVRSALGASRRRIVGQLFAEALLLSLLGAALGLGLAHFGLQQISEIFDGREGVAFWVDYGLQGRSIGIALALAVLSAVVVGVVPGLKSTGRGLDADLRRLGTGASVRLGWAWTALIVVQVAIAVTVLPTALHIGYQEIRRGAVRSTFPAHEFLTAQLGLALPIQPGMDGDEYRREAGARFAARFPELERRLEAEPTVAGVTFETRLPGRGSSIEIERGSEAGRFEAHSVLSTGVATDYFELMGARILTGRAFRSSDSGESGAGVIVNEAFVRRVLDGGPALGRRLRFLPEGDPALGYEPSITPPWLEIVGVVEDLQASAFDQAWAPPFAYYAVPPGALQSASLLVRVRGGDAHAFAPRLRQIASGLDRDFRVGSVENLNTLRNPRVMAVAVGLLLLVLGTVLLLSAAGIHALMSLTVTRRRKEIGVRTALGARSRQLLVGIFARAAWQLGSGGLLGALVGGALLLGTGAAGRQAAIVLSSVVALMLTTGLLAAVGPARRGLRIQPMEALRED